MSASAKPFMKGEPGEGALSNKTNEILLNGVSEANLHATGVKLVLGGMWPPFNLRPRRTALEEALHQMRELDDFSGRRPGFGIAGDSQEARNIMSTGRIAVLPQLEGGEGIQRVEDVDALYAGGVRVITVVHFLSTQLGGAAKDQTTIALLGKKPDGSLNPEGLTPLGRAAIERMVQLGIVIDLAHASDRFVTDVLEIVEPLQVPILVSHTTARSLSNAERNLSDELAKRVVAGGGIIGLSLNRSQLATDSAHELGPNHQHKTCDDLVAHWKHFASVTSPDALVLGSDVNGFITRAEPGGLCPDGIRHYGDLNQVWSALVANGIPRASLDSMAERLLKLVEKVESRADQSAQQEAKRTYARVRDERSVLEGVP